jgi:hypothetical protein
MSPIAVSAVASDTTSPATSQRVLVIPAESTQGGGWGSALRLDLSVGSARRFGSGSRRDIVDRPSGPPRKEHRMASTLTFELRRVDGTPADPPSFQTVAPLWRPGDTIPLGRRTLRVIGVRHDDDADKTTVLIVEDMAVM